MDADGEAVEDTASGHVPESATSPSREPITKVAAPPPGTRLPWAEAWRGPAPLLGTFIQFPSPSIVEVIGHAGLDFVIVDLEHGEFGIAAIPDLCRAADASGLHTIVRAATNDPVMIGKSLDFGASAVLVPHIDTAADASAAVAAARYPPTGTRGAYPVLRAARYGSAYEPGWEARQNGSPSVILLIESAAGIDNLSEIVRTPGVDGIFIGPVDLSHSLGLAGNADHPRVRALVREVGGAAMEAGLRAGTFCPTVDAAVGYADAGFKLLAHSVDSQILLSGYTAARKAFWSAGGGRAAVDGRQPGG